MIASVDVRVEHEARGAALRRELGTIFTDDIRAAGDVTHLVPTVFAHGSEGAADVVVVVEVVEAVDVVPVVVDVVAVPIDVPSL